MRRLRPSPSFLILALLSAFAPMPGRTALFKHADDSGTMFLGKRDARTTLHLHAADEESRRARERLAIAQVQIVKPYAPKDNRLERVAIRRMIEAGYYTHEQGETLMGTDEGLLPGQCTYVGVQEGRNTSPPEKDDEHSDLGPIIIDPGKYKSPWRSKWTGMVRLVSGQMPLALGPATHTIGKRPGVRMPWQGLNRFTKGIAARHFKPDEFKWNWEFSRGFNLHPKTTWPILRAAALLAYRELDIWGGKLDDARIFIHTRRMIGEPKPKNPDDPNYHERLYRRWGFTRLGNHEPGPHGQVILVAKLRDILNPKLEDLREIDPSIEQFADPNDPDLDHSAYQILDEAWNAKDREYDLYLDGASLPVSLGVRDYTETSHRTMERLARRIKTESSNHAARYFSKDQEHGRDYANGATWRLWKYKGQIGIERLEAIMSARAPVPTLRSALLGIWLDHQKRSRAEGLTPQEASTRSLSFTTDDDKLAAVMIQGLKIVEASRLFESNEYKTKKHYFEIPGETLNRWADEHPEWVEEARRTIGGVYNDAVTKLKAPFAL
jgi:hypothetical protein